MQEVSQLITNVGFPIVACLILISGYSKVLKPLTTTIADLNRNILLLNERIENIERKVDDLL